MTEKGFSPIEKISIACIIFSSLYLIYTSYQPVVDALSGKKFEQQYFITNLAILMIGSGGFIGGINLAKRSIVMDRLIDMGFENGIYTRLEPVLKEISGSQVALYRMEEQIKNMNINIDRLGNRSVQLKIGNESAFGIDLRAEIMRFLRYVLLINITLAAFIFLMTFTRSYTPLLLTILYFIWWLEISYEYSLWDRSSAWIWVFIPLLLIPIATILGDIMFGSEILLGGMFIGLAIYATTYYSWGKYIIEGTLPFDINKIPSSPANIYIVNFRKLISGKHDIIRKSLFIFSFIWLVLLIIQVISVNLYELQWFPRFSIDQLFFLSVLSIVSYLSARRMKKRKKAQENLNV
ncbi:MAG TPA: hypothetical protein VN368_03350 [Candidatus Methylomirabilis sp.]|nr:hypothetical protein [Candidatus Methylomirabilis sp.]